jgi:xanthine dehydrogenase accessory protein XdhC
MMAWWQKARDAFDQGESCVLVTVTGVRGSAPRAAGTPMIVFDSGFAGTIGGGALEFQATTRARELSADSVTETLNENWVLGPDIGQCCGGSVDVHFERMSAEDFNRIQADDEAHQAALPQVYVFGAGHVGLAVARATLHLPVRLICVDERENLLQQIDPFAWTILTKSPVTEMAALPAQALVFVMSHSHALDFDLCQAALQRDDLPFVGLIGSATKRARFRQRLTAAGFSERRLSRLISPIGIAGIAGKEPAVIGVSVAAQILQVVEQQAAETRSDKLRLVEKMP